MATTITANGINFPDGSAGSPSIGGSDTNTGLFTGSDIVGFATGGSERLRIDASGNVNIANDSGKLQLGASADLQIYHSGSHSFIDHTNGTGHLVINSSATNNVDIMKAGHSEYMARFKPDDAVELYYDNSKKFQTQATGVRFVAAHTFMDDNYRARFGANDDLQIYHTGTVSRIQDVGTGGLEITSDGTGVDINKGLSEYMARFITDGAVELYHNNTKRFETDSIGVKLEDNNHVSFGTGSDFKIHFDGSNAYLDANAGNVYFRGNSNEAMLQLHQNGAVELYHDNSKRFETNNTGAFCTGELGCDGLYMGDNEKAKFGNGDDLQIFHDGGDSHIKDTGTGGLYLSTSQFLVRNAAGTEFMIQGQEDGNVTLYHNGNQKAFTQIWGFQVNGVLAPQNDDTHDLGFSNERWDDVYATNGTINTSDRNEKNTITTSDLGLSFINKLKPVSYKFNNKTRTHYGLIAQDVETTLSDISKATSDFAGFIKEDIPDKLYEEDDDIPEGKSVGDVKTAAFTTYGLRYHEFISPLIKAMQELTAKVEALEAA